MKTLLVTTLFAGLVMAAPALRADDTNAATAEWKLLEATMKPPQTPAEWKQRHPTDQEVAKLQAEQKDYARKAAAQMRKFAAQYPATPEGQNAKRLEYNFLSQTLDLRDTNALSRVLSVGDEVVKLPGMSADERFDLKMSLLQLKAMSHHGQDPKQTLGTLEGELRALMKEFPERKDAWPLLLDIASEYETERSRKLLTEIAANADAPAEVKQMAEGQVKKLDMLGKPLAMKFTALDGREVDLAKLKGKVVLVDFWATWCGPCVAELPKVLATYQKLHPQGLEIVGISFDEDKAKLEKYVKDVKIEWPQYFDGKKWQNKFGQEYAIFSIPTMWLVDKQGKLRDINARQDLEAQVAALLAEK